MTSCQPLFCILLILFLLHIVALAAKSRSHGSDDDESHHTHTTTRSHDDSDDDDENHHTLTSTISESEENVGDRYAREGCFSKVDVVHVQSGTLAKKPYWAKMKHAVSAVADYVGRFGLRGRFAVNIVDREHCTREAVTLAHPNSAMKSDLSKDKTFSGDARGGHVPVSAFAALCHIIQEEKWSSGENVIKIVSVVVDDLLHDEGAEVKCPKADYNLREVAKRANEEGIAVLLLAAKGNSETSGLLRSMEKLNSAGFENVSVLTIDTGNDADNNIYPETVDSVLENLRWSRCDDGKDEDGDGGKDDE